MKNWVVLPITFWVIFSAIGQAQQSSIIQSQPFEKNKTNRTYSLLKYDSTGYYVLRFDQAQRYAELEHYDVAMEHLQTYKVTDKRRRYIGVVNIKEHMHMLYFRYKRVKGRGNEPEVFENVSLYAKRINPQTFKLDADSIELLKPFRMESNYFRGNFAISPDKNKILIYTFEEMGDIEDARGLTNKVNLMVFDPSFKLLWRREVNLAPKGVRKRVVVIKKLRINNNGEVAILSDIFRNEERRTYSSKDITTDPTLFFVGKQPQNFARFTPDMGELYFNGMDFSFDQQGNILWFGFYSKQKYYQQIGTFFVKINSSKTKVLVKKKQDFSNEFLQKVLNRKKITRVIEPRMYQLVYWHRTDDGGVTISAEQQPHSPSSFKSHGLMVFRFNAEGEVVWSRYIYKHAAQAKKMRPFLSHYMFVQNDYTYIFYNKGIYSDGYAQAIRLNSEGKIRRRRFFQYETQQELLCPQLSQPLSNGLLFLSMQDRYYRVYRFGIADLKSLFKDRKGD